MSKKVKTTTERPVEIKIIEPGKGHVKGQVPKMEHQPPPPPKKDTE